MTFGQQKNSGFWGDVGLMGKKIINASRLPGTEELNYDQKGEIGRLLVGLAGEVATNED